LYFPRELLMSFLSFYKNDLGKKVI
jgi:hypothetical protein